MAYNPPILQFDNSANISMTSNTSLSGLDISNIETDELYTTDNKRYIGKNESSDVSFVVDISNSISTHIEDISANNKLICIFGSVKSRQIKFSNNMYVLNIYINNRLIQSINDCFDKHDDIYGKPNLSTMEDIYFEYCLNDDPIFSSGSSISSYTIKFEIKHAYEDIFIDENIALYVPDQIHLNTYTYVDRDYNSDDKHTKYVLIETQNSSSVAELYLKHAQSWIVDSQTNNLTNIFIPTQATNRSPSVYVVDSSYNVIENPNPKINDATNRFKQGYNQSRIIKNHYHT